MSRVWLPVPCVICGQPHQQLCTACSNSLRIRPRAITRISGLTGWAVADYSGEVSSLVRAFKASGSRVLQRYLAREIAAVLAGQMGASQLGAGQLGSGLPGAGRERPIWLIPAPSSRASLKTRGFVPAKLLASAVARELRVSGLAGVKVIDCLRISGNTRDQAGLGKTERFENLRGKIAASPKGFNLPASRPTLVLIDDIVTTGATLLEMQRSLSEVGLPAEFFATFAETL